VPYNFVIVVQPEGNSICRYCSSLCCLLYIILTQTYQEHYLAVFRGKRVKGKINLFLA